MNLVLLFDDDFVEERRVRLTGRRCEHVRKVHRAEVGQSLRVGRLNGLLGTGQVVQIGADVLEMQVILDRPPPATLPCRLLLALPRPKILRRALQAAVTMGVKEIVLMKTWRVEKSFWQSPVLTDNGLREQVVLALEQARDTIPPAITLERRFKPFVEDRLPALAAGSLCLAAHPPSPRLCPGHVGGHVTLAIGPEGGFLAYEIAMLERAGFASMSLGPRVLRVDQAVPALLGRLF